MKLKPKTQNLKSRHWRSQRRGVTIVEVLFAILVATVGIFSVIVIFPFASAQARRARINDMLANAGRGAFHDFDTRGMRRANERWMACNPQTGFLIPVSLLPIPVNKSESVCIDPRMMAAHTTTGPLVSGQPAIWPQNCVQQMQQLVSSTGSPGGQCVQVFPYVQPGTTPYLISSPPPLFSGAYMRRLTLWSGATNAAGQKLAMSLAQANSIFLIDDDIAYQRPDGPSPQFPNDTRTSGARQDATPIFGSNLNLGEWLKRDSERKISWIATLVPQIDPVSQIASDEYTLSVVMIYDRANDLQNLEFPSPAIPTSVPKERRVFGALQTTGATGGEIRLGSAFPDQLKLKANQWVMVSGTYPLPNGVTRFQWYRITECDKDPEPVAGGLFQVNATLMGQDWNTAYISATAAPFATGSEYAVNVDIVEGAFAVYEKTIRLEYGSSM